MHRAVALTLRSSLPINNKIARSLSIKLAKPRFFAPCRVLSSSRHRLAPSTASIFAMASTSSTQPSVAVVTTQGCPYCRQAKADLNAAGIFYTEILITDQLDVLNEIKKTTGQSTVPQVKTFFSSFFYKLSFSVCSFKEIKIHNK
jgi:glutaredoxin